MQNVQPLHRSSDSQWCFSTRHQCSHGRGGGGDWGDGGGGRGDGGRGGGGGKGGGDGDIRKGDGDGSLGIGGGTGGAAGHCGQVGAGGILLRNGSTASGAVVTVALVPLASSRSSAAKASAAELTSKTRRKKLAMQPVHTTNAEGPLRFATSSSSSSSSEFVSAPSSTRTISLYNLLLRCGRGAAYLVGGLARRGVAGDASC